MKIKVLRLRQKLLLTQKEFSEKLGISRQMVHYYEVGTYKVGLKVIHKMIELAKENNIIIDTDYFFIN